MDNFIGPTLHMRIRPSWARLKADPCWMGENVRYYQEILGLWAFICSEYKKNRLPLLRAGKEIRGLGRAGVRQPSSSTPRSRVHEVEERLHITEERAEKAEAVSQKLSKEMTLVKQQLAAVMTFIAQQTGCPP